MGQPGLPVQIIVRVGAGLIEEGRPVGEASGMQGFPVTDGICLHEITMESMPMLLRLLAEALAKVIGEGEKQRGGKKNGADSNLVA